MMAFRTSGTPLVRAFRDCRARRLIGLARREYEESWRAGVEPVRTAADPSGGREASEIESSLLEKV